MHNKILIVEDEVITAMDLERTLQSLDFDVVGLASSGKEAIKMTEELMPDLVLMDIFLKGRMDGIEATREIQTLYDIPVVYLTAYSDKKTLKRIKSTKPYGFLTKPVNSDGLEGTIETALYNYDLDKKLRESEEKYRRIVENYFEGICTIDKNYIISFINQRLTEILGFKTEDMVGKPCNSFIFDEDLEDYKNKLENRKKGITERYKWKFRHKNGSEVWAIVSVSPVIDKNSNFAGSFAMFQTLQNK